MTTSPNYRRSILARHGYRGEDKESSIERSTRIDNKLDRD